jgi:HEPN domain-containing protein
MMSARQFDLTCDEIEQVYQSKFNAITPLVVNLAFTCELYLKALLFITKGESMKRHDLQKLYSRQTVEVQESIYKEYYALHQTRPVPEKYRGEMNKEIFAAELAEVKDAFEDWRYAYEKDESIRLGILKFLRMSLRKVASRLYDGLNF